MTDSLAAGFLALGTQDPMLPYIRASYRVSHLCQLLYLKKTTSKEVLNGLKPENVRSQWEDQQVAIGQVAYDDFVRMWVVQHDRAKQVSEALHKSHFLKPWRASNSRSTTFCWWLLLQELEEADKLLEEKRVVMHAMMAAQENLKTITHEFRMRQLRAGKLMLCVWSLGEILIGLRWHRTEFEAAFKASEVGMCHCSSDFGLLGAAPLLPCSCR